MGIAPKNNNNNNNKSRVWVGVVRDFTHNMDMSGI
jgi:hypothetical protein